MSGTTPTPNNVKISQAPDAGPFNPAWRIPVAIPGDSRPYSTDAGALQLGGLFLPLAGGNPTGMINLVDNPASGAGGAIQSHRNIVWTGRSADAANQPFKLNLTITGTILDPAGAQFALPTGIIQTLNQFNTGSLGFRGFMVQTEPGPGTIGNTISAITSTVTQYSPYPPGNNIWQPGVQYNLNTGITNDLSHYAVIQPGISDPNGQGPTGYGEAIEDGSVVWSYMGPGVPDRWAPDTDYLQPGQLVLNAINGGLFRVKTIGTSGAAPGPIRPTGAEISAGFDINNIPDGSVVWEYKTIGFQSQSYIGAIINQQSTFNCGGRSFNESVGTMWGMVLGSRLNTNATFYSASVPLEIDDVVQGSIRTITALKLVRVGKQAEYVDCAMSFSAAPNLVLPDGSLTQGYKNVLMFNRCIDPNGYGISFEAIGLAVRQHAAGVIDMKMMLADGKGAFGGGFLFRGPNGMYDQFGAWQMRFGSITPTDLGLSIDITNQELVSLTIVPGQGGGPWNVGDGFKSDDGAWGFIRTIDPNGGALTVSIVMPSQVSIPGPATVQLSPFNPEASFDAFGTIPEPGTVGPTGDVFWAAPATAQPVYQAPVNPTLYLGTNSAVSINLGNAASNTFINGQISAPLLPNAVNDNAAAIAGVRVGQWYRNGSVLMQRAA